MLAKISYLDPVLSPKIIRHMLADLRGKKITMRMLSHVVKATIGESAIPADGHGTKRGFSIQDAALIVTGSDLADLGLSPQRVQLCVNTARHAWKDLVPASPELLGTGSAQLDSKNHKYLVAQYIPDGFMGGGPNKKRGFVADIVSKEEYCAPLEDQLGRGMVVYNLTLNLSLTLAKLMGMIEGAQQGFKEQPGWKAVATLATPR